GVAEADREAWLAGRVLGAQDDPAGMRRRRDAFAEQADHLGSLHAETACHAIWAVPEPSRSGLDAFACLIARASGRHIVEDVGNSGHRDACLARDIPYTNSFLTHRASNLFSGLMQDRRYCHAIDRRITARYPLIMQIIRTIPHAVALGGKPRQWKSPARGAIHRRSSSR